MEKSAFSNGLRAPFSAMFLLSYHAFVMELFGNSDGDLELCHRLVERYLKLYPDVSKRFVYARNFLFQIKQIIFEFVLKTGSLQILFDILDDWLLQNIYYRVNKMG